MTDHLEISLTVVGQLSCLTNSHEASEVGEESSRWVRLGLALCVSKRKSSCNMYILATSFFHFQCRRAINAEPNPNRKHSFNSFINSILPEHIFVQSARTAVYGVVLRVCYPLYVCTISHSFQKQWHGTSYVWLWRTTPLLPGDRLKGKNMVL